MMQMLLMALMIRKALILLHPLILHGLGQGWSLVHAEKGPLASKKSTPASVSQAPPLEPERQLRPGRVVPSLECSCIRQVVLQCCLRSCLC